MKGYDKGYRLRNLHGDVYDSTTPFQVDGVEAQETTPVSPTLTYNGKAAAGAVSIASVKLKPIIENEGSRVASYWGKSKNLVYQAYADGNAKKENSWLTSVTETNGSAAITIYDPNKNLEEMFESLTGTVKRFVVKVYDTAGGTLYGWVRGVSASSDVYTFEVFNNRLTEGNQNWVGTLASFDNASLDKVEIYFYNSSFAFGTGTCFTEEVDCPREYSKSRKAQLEYAEGLSNGQYFVDYWRGELIGVKADNTASETVTYNVWSSTSGGSSGPSANVNVEKVGGTATSTNTGDADAGTQRVAVASDQIGLIGGGVGGGDSVYSTAQGDFTASVTDSSNDIVLSVDSLGGASLTEDHFANAILKVYDASTEEMVKITLDDFTWTSGTKTLDTTNCTNTFTFATGDVVSLLLIGPDKRSNTLTDSQRSTLTRDLSDQYTEDTFVLTNVPNATPDETTIVSMDGYDGISIHIEETGGSDSFTATVEASNEGTDSTDDWLDVTQYGFSNATGADAASYTADTLLFSKDGFNAKGVKVKIETADGSDDWDGQIFIKRWKK